MINELFEEYRLKILSNDFIYEGVEREGVKDEVTVGYHEEGFIHSMNKNEFVDVFQMEDKQQLLRKNIILMGDILEDCHMVKES
mmetsp:Transcript_3366/g.5636  ORF Transcript_3366/g.5636 Transcript_3366/m.5636 type:complete len:84 (-) Transcript_3366:263-514(-)